MTALGFILNGIAQVLSMVLSLVMWIVIIRALLSWVNPDPYNPIVRFLTEVSEPLLRPIRRYVPLVGPGIDLSPIILLLVIVFLQSSLVPMIGHYAREISTTSVNSQY